MSAVTALGQSSPITVTGLPAGKWRFTVAASNGLGTGAASSESVVVAIAAPRATGASWSYEAAAIPSTDDWWLGDPGDNNNNGNVDYATQDNWLVGGNQYQTPEFSDLLSIINDPSATDGRALRMTCRPTSSSERGQCGGSSYVGAQLVSKTNWTAGYWEWRMRTPVVTAGMWPCLWLYNNCTNNGHENVADGHHADEIDIAEIFGGQGGTVLGDQFSTTLHGRSDDPNHGLGNGGRDTMAWHTYGVDYDPDSPRCDIYYDGAKIMSDSADYCSYFANGSSSGGPTPFNVRMNYSVNTGSADFFPGLNGTPSLYWDIDYCRYYSSKPS